MNSKLQPLAAVLGQPQGTSESEGPGARDTLFETKILGVPILRAGLQIGGALLAVYFFGEIARKFPPALQMGTLAALAAIGSLVGYYLWDVLGRPLTDFLAKVFPFSFS